MKFTDEHGLLCSHAVVEPPPLVAVLEVSGAILEWTVDDPGAQPRVTLTEPAEADWLWRVFGEQAHVALVTVGPDTGPLEVVVDPAAWTPLRRLALGHWLRRWWPTSARDGIVELDPVVLDAEVALLTAAAEDFFAEPSLDADLTGLLAGVATRATPYESDPRVAALLAAAEELGMQAPAQRAEPARRAEFALTAGGPEAAEAGAIASGRASLSWTAVPPGIFDAAEGTVSWSIAAPDDSPVLARVRAEPLPAAPASPLAAGIAVRLRCAEVDAVGVLDQDAEATLLLPLSQSAAWDRDWSPTRVDVGAGPGEPAEARERVRRFVRSRLADPPSDAFLAELLAAEADF